MSNTFTIPDGREGFSMKVDGIHLNLPDLHMIAADLNIQPRDILVENGVLTIYNTSQECQEIVNDNALASFVAMSLDISPESISNITPVKAKPKVIERDVDFDDDED